MPDPAELLAVSRLLLSPVAGAQPSDAQLRRAVSTAYYAVFHAIVRVGTLRFMGAGTETTAGYPLLYRGFNHGRLKTVCDGLAATTLNSSLKQQLGRQSVSQSMRDFASAFPALQEGRLLADYDPSIRFELSDATDLVDAAETALAALERVEPAEKTDVLALMLVNAR